jgi:ribosomal protein S21
MQVTLREGESFEGLLKRFRSGFTRQGIISEFKRHQSYLSKGEKLRAKAQRAERKRLARLAKQARRQARRPA